MVDKNNKDGELLQGTLDMLVLRALVRGPMRSLEIHTPRNRAAPMFREDTINWRHRLRAR